MSPVFWTLLAIPGALMVVLSHTQGHVLYAGALVSAVWLGAAVVKLVKDYLAGGVL